VFKNTSRSNRVNTAYSRQMTWTHADGKTGDFPFRRRPDIAGHSWVV
jgi:hypothetical protein